jgi:hypothetical protein
MPTAAIGFRAHSGWAAMVAVTGEPRRPAVIERRRVELADPAVPGSVQPYHAAEPMKLDDAEAFINGCIERTGLLAKRALRAALDDLQQIGYEVIGCGILLASGRPLPGLTAILASHALIHTAEGELFRDALKHASRESRLPVTAVKEREVYERAAAELATSTGELQSRITEMGRAIGPPWRQDEKLAALIAWLALGTTM